MPGRKNFIHLEIYALEYLRFHCDQIFPEIFRPANLQIFAHSRSLHFLILGSHKQATNSQQLVFVSINILPIAKMVHQIYSQAESVLIEFKLVLQSNEPAHKTFSHFHVDFRMPFHIIIRNSPTRSLIGHISLNIVEQINQRMMIYCLV